jgi:histidinol-phosphate phosphatase family protein
MMSQSPAVFLDRDGTLLEEVGYLDRLERLTIFPFSVDGVRLLNRAGFKVVVITNQAGVARGLVEEPFVGEAHSYLAGVFAEGGATIDGWYYCPHHPDAPIEAYRQQCECRKPRPGMIRRAERDLDLDLARSFVVGDRWLDVELARAVGARGVLVRTGYGASEERRPQPGIQADAVVDNLMAAVTWILRHVTQNVERRT